MESDGGTRQRNCTPGIDEEGITETPELGPYEMKRGRTIHENEKILTSLVRSHQLPKEDCPDKLSKED